MLLIKIFTDSKTNRRSANSAKNLFSCVQIEQSQTNSNILFICRQLVVQTVRRAAPLESVSEWPSLKNEAKGEAAQASATIARLIFAAFWAFLPLISVETGRFSATIWWKISPKTKPTAQQRNTDAEQSGKVGHLTAGPGRAKTPRRCRRLANNLQPTRFSREQLAHKLLLPVCTRKSFAHRL